MPELTEEQRAKLDQEAREAQQEAHEVLTEKEQSAPGFQAPETALPEASESAIDVKERLARPNATVVEPEAVRELTDAEKQEFASALLNPKTKLSDLADRFGFKGTVDRLGGQIPGEEEK